MAKSSQLSVIGVKSAVLAAIRYLQELGEFVPTDEVRLEETEHDDHGDWLITLSTLEPADQGAAGQLLPRRRSYKVFRIDAETGGMKSMKVRTLQPIE